MRTLPAVSILCLALCVGCQSESASGDGKQASASEAEAGFVAGLVERARSVWETESDELGYEAGEDGDHVTYQKDDPIVRCYVDGRVEFTNQSRCGARGGRGATMALKAKNDR